MREITTGRQDVIVTDHTPEDRPVRLALVSKYGDTVAKALTKGEAVALARALLLAAGDDHESQCNWDGMSRNRAQCIDHGVIFDLRPEVS